VGPWSARLYQDYVCDALLMRPGIGKLTGSSASPEL